MLHFRSIHSVSFWPLSSVEGKGKDWAFLFHAFPGINRYHPDNHRRRGRWPRPLLPSSLPPLFLHTPAAAPPKKQKFACMKCGDPATAPLRSHSAELQCLLGHRPSSGNCFLQTCYCLGWRTPHPWGLGWWMGGLEAKKKACEPEISLQFWASFFGFPPEEKSSDVGGWVARGWRPGGGGR